MSKDDLSARMKHQYEMRAQSYLPRRTYTIIRLDGKAFHTYTRGLDKPYDLQFMGNMAHTAIFLCQEIEGAVCGYVQSDEISILLTDFTNIQTQAWFDGNVQKIVSISASLATAKFNELRPGKLAFFDSRAFTIPDPVEVHNYFVWRQKDATRNSINAAAQTHYSHKELQGKSCADMQEMLYQKGVNWNDYNEGFKRGLLVVKHASIVADQIRTTWSANAAPIFTQDDLLINIIPTYA